MMAAVSCDLSQCVMTDTVRGSFESRRGDLQSGFFGCSLTASRFLGLFVIVKSMPLHLIAIGRRNPLQQPNRSVVEHESVSIYAELVQRIHLVQPESPDFVAALDDGFCEVSFSSRIAQLPGLDDGP